MKVKYIGFDESPVSVMKGCTYECLGKEYGSFRIIDDADEDYLYPCEEFKEVEDDSKIEIHYMNSLAGTANCFSLLFYLKEYIPERYFHVTEDGRAADLYFFLDLFKKRGLFSGKKADCKEFLDEHYYSCESNMGKFTMVYDSAYDVISFSVEDEKQREKIARLIKQLVEKRLI